MIAYIDLPLRGTERINGHDVLVIGLVATGHRINGRAQIEVVYVDQDGSVGQARLSEINVNWRFDDRTRKWMDVDTGEELGSDDGES